MHILHWTEPRTRIRVEGIDVAAALALAGLDIAYKESITKHAKVGGGDSDAPRRLERTFAIVLGQAPKQVPVHIKNLDCAAAQRLVAGKRRKELAVDILNTVHKQFGWRVRITERAEKIETAIEHVDLAIIKISGVDNVLSVTVAA